MSNLAAILRREKVKLCRYYNDDNDVHFVLDQHADLDINSASSLTQQSVVRHVGRSTRTHYSDSEPTSLCSYSLKLCA